MSRDNDPRQMIRRLNQVGLAVVAVLVGGIGGWAATGELAGAVIAPGRFVVQSNIKKVQHPTGGIVGEILVKEGDLVEAGQVVLRLDDTVSRATLGVVRSQLDEVVAREARLLAEREGADRIEFPEDLVKRSNDKAVAALIAGQERLFESQKQAQEGRRAQLRERISQTNEEIRGLSAQRDAKQSEIKLIEEELVGVTDLYRKNLVTIVRYMQLQREHAKLQGERGQFVADMARARAKIGETELQIIQLEQDFRTEVLKELRDVQGKIAELRERFTAAEDQLKRIEIRAPQAGFVHQLGVHTVGGVIANGETIMQIVPRADELVIEAKVAPPDIDQVIHGAATVVRVMAGNQRTNPELNGEVSYVSADLTHEAATNLAYYVVRATLLPDQVERLGELKLVPGMPAELFIRTASHTPLQYLLKPLQEQISRTFRER
jgi:HlyD family secretion protein